MLKSFEFRKYPLNIFTLNSKALVIQHAFFGVKTGIRKIIPRQRKLIKQIKKENSKSFITSSSSIKHSKSALLKYFS